ncbi:MAG: dihydroneopterin aldolase [Flavobacteriaceae bacterium TMED220]|jgi:dihydroneopterin aldolase|nr:MAG: dihydroneopterin aldolase [Flavobacteriaceae bacterium TMED220]|tara:strand:+ start:3192 stop:3566 length:375 start_codon:yes stop_codon:yes gene_type:complete
MGKIKLKDIKIYAYHGCLSEENLIGGEYLVNLSVFSNLKKSSLSDELKDTIDYVSLLDIVKKEMLSPSKLLENVVKRVVDKIFLVFPKINKVSLEVSKLNPPINGNVFSVSVKNKVKRKEMHTN